MDPVIQYFTQLFSIPYDRYAIHPENYYNTAMCCTFSCSEQVPLSRLFYNGFPFDQDVTDEEQAYVDDFLEVKRLEPNRMDEVLNQYFGITLENINFDKQKIRYWEQTGCYYVAGNDMLMNTDFSIYAICQPTTKQQKTMERNSSMVFKRKRHLPNPGGA